MAEPVESVVVNLPPPAKPATMIDQIAAMQPGDALAFPGKVNNAVSVAASRVKSKYPDRRFTVATTAEGPTVWRLKNPTQKESNCE